MVLRILQANFDYWIHCKVKAEKNLIFIPSFSFVIGYTQKQPTVQFLQHLSFHLKIDGIENVMGGDYSNQRLVSTRNDGLKNTIDVSKLSYNII